MQSPRCKLKSKQLCHSYYFHEMFLKSFIVKKKRQNDQHSRRFFYTTFSACLELLFMQFSKYNRIFFEARKISEAFFSVLVFICHCPFISWFRVLTHMVFLWALLIASVTYQLLRNLHPQIFRPIKPHFLYFKTPLKYILKDIFVMETCFWLEKVSQIISTFWGGLRSSVSPVFLQKIL